MGKIKNDNYSLSRSLGKKKKQQKGLEFIFSTCLINGSSLGFIITSCPKKKRSMGYGFQPILSGSDQVMLLDYMWVGLGSIFFLKGGLGLIFSTSLINGSSLASVLTSYPRKKRSIGHGCQPILSGLG